MSFFRIGTKIGTARAFLVYELCCLFYKDGLLYSTTCCMDVFYTVNYPEDNRDNKVNTFY